MPTCHRREIYFCLRSLQFPYDLFLHVATKSLHSRLIYVELLQLCDLATPARSARCQTVLPPWLRNPLRQGIHPPPVIPRAKFDTKDTNQANALSFHPRRSTQKSLCVLRNMLRRNVKQRNQATKHPQARRTARSAHRLMGRNQQQWRKTVERMGSSFGRTGPPSGTCASSLGKMRNRRNDSLGPWKGVLML